MKSKLLNVEELVVTFKTDQGVFKAVDSVSFSVNKGEILGMVGESGCGKSVTAMSILRLIPLPSGAIENGKIIFKEKNLLNLDINKMRKIRGNAISMIFQEPGAALSPLHRIGHQMVEALLLHKKTDKKNAWRLAEKWLTKAGIPDAKEKIFAYPYQLSGGMQQRVMIAMALITEPELIIADEPTTALDVTIQLQIFELLRDIRRSGTSILLITHDMGVIWEMCDRVLVMYASKIVEEGSAGDIFSRPAHPYTRGLLKSIPKLQVNSKRLQAISGQVPSPFDYPKGCNFYDRCPHAFDRCKNEVPKQHVLENNHKAACFIAEKLISTNL